MRSFCDHLLALLLLLGVLCAFAPVAQAGTYEDALPGFTEGSLSDTGEAIDKAAASGSPLAAPLLEALSDARLLFSAEKKLVFIKTKDGKLLDAANGKPFTAIPPDDIDTVVVNNRLRNIISAAIGGLTLMSPDPDRRYEAAQAVFKSHEQSALPTLESALAKETAAHVKKALSEARAAVILASPDTTPSDKITAIAVIGSRGDQDALGLLQGLPSSEPP